MIFATKPQFPFCHQNLQGTFHRFLPKHNGKFQLLQIDELIQLECYDQFALLCSWISTCTSYLNAQLISMKLLDLCPSNPLLGCRPLSSLGKMKAVVCQVACWAWRIWWRWHDLGAGVFELAQGRRIGIVDDVDVGHDNVLWPRTEERTGLAEFTGVNVFCYAWNTLEDGLSATYLVTLCIAFPVLYQIARPSSKTRES